MSLSSKNRVVRALGSTEALGAAIFAFSVIFPPFDDATTLDLTTHMVQHVLIVLSGVLVIYPIHKRGTLSRIEGRRSGMIGLLIVCLLVGFWHLGTPWDDAVLNPAIHAVEHLSFFVVGLLIGSAMMDLSDRNKIDVLLLGFFGHFGYGLLLISQYQFYPLYSMADQGALGVVMFGVGPFYWVGLLYLIFKNRAWFQGETPEVAAPSREEKPRRVPNLGPMKLAITSILLAVLIVFYAGSAAAIVFATDQPSPHGATVHINETPVSWQYSPENITVVIGANNTVTWVSNSLSYDTITSNVGAFSSPPIAPGQTFSYTFTQPGTYDYYCIYHPWMVGSVRVLSGEAPMTARRGGALDWLLKDDEPSIRYLALTSLLGKSERDSEVRAAKKLIGDRGWAAAILARQHGGGWWKGEENLYRPKYISTNWMLLILSDLGLTKEDPSISKACEIWIDRFSKKDGGFGADGWSKSHLCIAGNTARALVRFGYGEHPKVKSAFNWLLENQSKNGGWSCFGSGGNLDSWEAMSAFAALPKQRWTKKMKSAVERGAEFYLDRELHKQGTEYHPWYRLHYPVHYYYDILVGLDFMTALGYGGDKRLGFAIDLLKKKMAPDGRWALDAVHPDVEGGMAEWFAKHPKQTPTRFALEKAGEPSKMITLRAMQVLSRLDG